MAEQANTIHQDMDENLMDEASFYRKLRQTSNGLLQGEEEEEEEEDAFLRALRTLKRMWQRCVNGIGVCCKMGSGALLLESKDARQAHLCVAVCVSVCCSVLQCVAVCCIVLQCVAVCGSV